MLGTSFPSRHKNFQEVCQSYIQLTKPRSIPLLLIITATPLCMASQGDLDPVLLSIVSIAIALATASAQTFNCFYDRDIDRQMVRTRNRPIPDGRVQPHHALIFAILLGSVSFSLFALFANLASAFLAMAGIGFYMVIYTHFVKRSTIYNIAIGGVAGSIPALVGWAAVTGSLSGTAWVLFAIFVLWSPPCFWAFALTIRDDFARANIPLLPVVKGETETVKQIFLYTLATILCTFLLIYPLGILSWIYGTIALILNSIFLYKAWKLKHNPLDKTLAKSMFKFSTLYLMILCAGMIVDSLFLSRRATILSLLYPQ